jgi:OmcA/MtrC family decaheme c-type cytochrome
VQNTYKELALTGTLNPRRTIVATAKCNACHGALGTTSGSNTLAEAFHGGARDIVEACVVCHDPNRASNGNIMTNGLLVNGAPAYESYQFKRMIHGIHGNSKRTNPFTHGNTTLGAFANPGGAPIAPWTTPMKDSKGIAYGTAGTGVENYAAEVAWPGVGINCNVCHVNNSYKQDLGPVATMIGKPFAAGSTTVLETDVNKWNVISPKAASCTACHDSAAAIGHVTTFGGASFGNLTQGGFVAAERESCDDCHAPGGFKGVDLVHGQN